MQYRKGSKGEVQHMKKVWEICSTEREVRERCST